MKKSLIYSFLWLVSGICLAQQSNYDVTAGNGNGVRFWASDNYKVHMGNAGEYNYGPVTDYSIKMNMNSTFGRGWTWGVIGATPIAALRNDGTMQIAKSMTASSFIAGGTIETNKSAFTKIQLAVHDWSGSHGLLFNAYKQTTVSGSLGATGNTKYANNVGNYGGGAGAIMFYGNGGSMGFYISPASTGQDQDVNWGNPVLWLQRNGNVAIGKGNPSEKLEVTGTIRATEVKVEAQWWDEVFEEEYELLPLTELEAFIKNNKHLPEIPTEAEVEANGVALGNTTSLLLKKIEELTLHLIEKEKQIDRLTENQELLAERLLQLEENSDKK